VLITLSVTNSIGAKTLWRCILLTSAI